MSVFYPDNANRGARVKQLMTQTTGIQSTFESTQKQIDNLSKIEDSVFETLSKAAGYPTVKQYIQAGLNTLTPAQKANYNHICDSLMVNNPHMQRSVMAAGAIAGLGTALRIIPKTIVAVVCKFSAFVHGVWGVLRGLVKLFTGAIEDGMAMIRTFATLIKVNWSRKLVSGVGTGVDIAEKTAKGLSWVKRAGKILQWVGIIAEMALLVVQLVEGAKEKKELQLAIIECCASRFGAKKIQLLVNQSMIWTSKMSGIVTSAALLYKKQEKYKNNPKLMPTDEDIHEAMLSDINEIVEKFDNELKDCNPDSLVLGELTLLDSKDAGGAWTEEDPDIQAMQKWIDEHPFKDKNGNVVPVDGPVSGNLGLIWTVTSSVKASTQNVEVRITGTNKDRNDASKTMKAQIFSSIHISIPITGSTKLFSKNNFKVKGAAGADQGDGLVSLETSGGAKGDGVIGIVEKPDQNDNSQVFLQFDIGVKDILQPIELPSQASITFVLKGTTAEAGKSALLIRENWWPDSSKDKVWEDAIIEKTA